MGRDVGMLRSRVTILDGLIAALYSEIQLSLQLR